jgi:predicted nucleotide-binding protein (sugar kinase/HSP70/actin superfamily)
LEKHGAEVVNASIAEWVNFITYVRLRDAKIDLGLNFRQFKSAEIWKNLKEIARYRAELYYQELRQQQVYKRVKPLIDIADDHKISHLEELLEEEDLFNFDIGTEACLSISGLLEYAREGFNGTVNVYPFTCMPSTATSAIINPVINRLGVPYLDTPYDSSYQPGREAAIRTFMHQAQHHLKRHGRNHERGN